MTIHEKINANKENSVLIIVFKNRRWDYWNGWIYDDLQSHTIKKDRLKNVLQKLNYQGYHAAHSTL